MKHILSKWRTALVVAIALFLPLAVLASHSWGNYHWARTSNPFTLKLGDNVSSTWDSYLAEASSDWSQSSVLNTTVVAGTTNPRTCRPRSGRIEVCNAKYGNNGWLGLAQIWITGGVHITQAVAKQNDTYFNTSTYNTPAWRRLVMCQEIAHGFGLDHQDENFGNPNLGSCMDYTGDPDGPPTNEHPNAHDYEQLEAIYGHLDGFNTISQSTASIAQSLARDGENNGVAGEVVGDSPSDWGKAIRDNGNVGLYVRELGAGRQVFTFVIWARE